MKRPRVLFISDKKLYRHKDRHLTNGQTPFQLSAFSKLFNVHVLTPVTPTDKPPRGLTHIEGDITFHSLGNLRYYLFLSVPKPWVKKAVCEKTAQCIQEIRPDAVVAKFPREVGVYGALTAAEHNVPTLLNYVYDWFSDIAVRLEGYPSFLVGWYKKWILRYRRRLTRLGCQKATAVTTVSRNFAVGLENICGREVFVLTNTYSLSDRFFAVPPLRARARFRVLYVGRIDRNKNLDTLVRAFAQVKARFSAARLAIVGDGPRLPHVRRLVKSLGLENETSFRGYVKNRDLPAVLADAGVLVLPSFSEALGQVLLEAMAAGRPVIGSDTGGIPELIHDGETGILIDPCKTESLTAALCRIMDDWDGAVRLGEKGREVAVQYTAEATNQRWIDAVNAILPEGSE